MADFLFLLRNQLRLGPLGRSLPEKSCFLFSIYFPKINTSVRFRFLTECLIPFTLSIGPITLSIDPICIQSLNEPQLESRMDAIEKHLESLQDEFSVMTRQFEKLDHIEKMLMQLLHEKELVPPCNASLFFRKHGSLMVLA